MADADTIDRYPWVTPITTRWTDNDVYGHINNATYYSYFDSAANLFLMSECGLDITNGQVIALVVESRCSYERPLAYPEALRAAVRVDRLGNRAVTWGIAIFDERNPSPAAHGYFVHVFVDRQTRRPVPIPEAIRAKLIRLER